MNTGSLALDFFFLMMVVDKPWVYAVQADNCTIAVTVQRNTKYYSKSGDSTSIECPVMYCQKKPNVHWHMYNTMLKKFFSLSLGPNHTTSWRTGNIFVLTFQPINKNDSGTYRCEANVANSTIAGHAIEVIVQDYSNITVFDDARNTTEDREASEKNKMLIIYILSSLGALGLFIFCCFGVLQSKRRLQGGNKTVSSTLEEETKELPSGSAVDSRQINCKKPNMVTSKPAHDKSVTNQLLSANQDTLVYATLNHREHFEKSEPFVETEFTEYAAIVLKN
ncbi:B- and T-lymphocyte attenuator-like [Sceloporus undulatus]|uniref:B- and T-lymphocyte attenuator-like n=1 Tax=Sceloporus undulatus TaxID=8520 RepID=UPI001C4AC1CC|nr:B- and T-lymphocyte attenuator-like [Sceloporus undulatus]XP_042298926.1 B- and T-lymphocyte attenuator-like [Sceloporus undulatus]